MYLRPSDPSLHSRGDRAAPLLIALVACLCAMLALSTLSVQSADGTNLGCNANPF